MPTANLFLVCRDPREFESVSRVLTGDRELRVHSVEDADDLRGVVRHVDPAAILLCVGSDFDPDEICRTLWVASLGQRSIPLVVLATRYRQPDARICFQLGVSDYLGRLEHRRHLVNVLRTVGGLGVRPEAPGGGMADAYPSRRFASLAD